MKTEKERLRKEFRAKLKSLSPEECASRNERLSINLKKLLDALAPTGFVAAFRARTWEPSVDGIFYENFRLCFPKVTNASAGDMEFREVAHPVEDLSFETGAFGLLEPTSRCPKVEKATIEVILVPLVAFDEKGGRVGQGKGFYDRFLQGYKGRVVGIGFEELRSKTPLPMEDWDRWLDVVVTDAGIKK
jgi:5-formyltetrahydrofolate cyclo-ligase